MKNLDDNFSGLTSLCGGLLAVFVFWFIRGNPFSFIFFFFLTFFLPYIFCSCKCERKRFYSIGRLGALTGTFIGWVVFSLGAIYDGSFLSIMSIPIFGFIFSRYYCMTYKEKDDAPIFKRFLIVLGGVITYIFLMYFFVAFNYLRDSPLSWFSYTIIFWAILLILTEYIGTKSIPHYLNNLGVAFIALLPLVEIAVTTGPLSLGKYMAMWYMALLILPPVFSLLYSIVEYEITYIDDTISVLCVGIICVILVAATLPLVTASS